MMSRYKPRGWRYESHRHSLAARGYTSKIVFKHGMDPDKLFRKDQLRAGMKVETEHIDDPQITKQIAKAHLAEIPDYYTKLAKMEGEGEAASVNGIPIMVDKLPEGTIYPITPDEVKKIFSNMDQSDLKGITSIEFKAPSGDQKEAWAQFIRSKKKIYIFAQPFAAGKIDGQDPDQLKKHIKEYVLPHEVGHLIALNQRHITDKKLSMAEARADAHVVGMDVEDKDVKIFEPAHRSGRS